MSKLRWWWWRGRGRRGGGGNPPPTYTITVSIATYGTPWGDQGVSLGQVEINIGGENEVFGNAQVFNVGAGSYSISAVNLEAPSGWNAPLQFLEWASTAGGFANASSSSTTFTVSGGGALTMVLEYGTNEATGSARMNWAGMVIEGENLTTAQANFQSPRQMNGTSTPGSGPACPDLNPGQPAPSVLGVNTAEWVGLGGYESTGLGLFQAGVDFMYAEVSGSCHPYAYPFVEIPSESSMYFDPGYANLYSPGTSIPFTISVWVNYSVNPRCLPSGQWYDSPTQTCPNGPDQSTYMLPQGETGTFCSFAIYSQGSIVWGTYQMAHPDTRFSTSLNPIQCNPQPDYSTAEWIVETPYTTNSQGQPGSNYGWNGIGTISIGGIEFVDANTTYASLVDSLVFLPVTAMVGFDTQDTNSYYYGPSGLGSNHDGFTLSYGHT